MSSRAMSCILCLVLVSAPGASPTASAADDPRPNIVLLLADDAGYADFGFHGSLTMRTPRLDRLASEGVVCTQAYVTASVCSPSRAGLLTGRYQQRFGHEFNLPGTSRRAEGGLPLTERTLADALRGHGYRTGVVGKWHLGLDDRFHPLERGFDEFVGLRAGSRSYFPQTDSAPIRRLERGREPIEEAPGSYLTDVIAEESVAFVERHAGAPFFLYVPFTAVHTPMHAREEDLAEHDGVDPLGRRTLAAMTTALDRAVGRILDALEAEGVAEHTLVLFLNDNGGATTNHSDNGTWRGMKGSAWEGGIRVPFLVRWPGVVAPGSTFAHPVSALDVFATALAAAGRDAAAIGASADHAADAAPALDGVDLRPYLDGSRDAGTGEPPHAALFWRRGVVAAVRQGRWKLVRVEGAEPILVDLDVDPGETVNRAEHEPVVTARLLDALAAWEADLAPPRWRTAERWTRNQVLKHRMDVVGRDAERRLP